MPDQPLTRPQIATLLLDAERERRLAFGAVSKAGGQATDEQRTRLRIAEERLRAAEELAEIINRRGA